MDLICMLAVIRPATLIDKIKVTMHSNRKA